MLHFATFETKKKFSLIRVVLYTHIIYLCTPHCFCLVVSCLSMCICLVGWLWDGCEMVGPLIVFRDWGGGVSPPPRSILDCAPGVTDGSLAGSIYTGWGWLTDR